MWRHRLRAIVAGNLHDFLEWINCLHAGHIIIGTSTFFFFTPLNKTLNKTNCDRLLYMSVRCPLGHWNLRSSPDLRPLLLGFEHSTDDVPPLLSYVYGVKRFSTFLCIQHQNSNHHAYMNRVGYRVNFIDSQFQFQYDQHLLIPVQSWRRLICD